MGGLFSKPKKPDPLPIPDPPIVQGIEGVGDEQRKKLVKSGRGGTILAGPLKPQNTGKKQLLGGGL